MIYRLFHKKFRATLAALAAAELFSFSAFFFDFTHSAFILICAAVAAITVYRLEYGLMIALVELMVGSMGYLFYAEIGGKEFSIRMALWAIILTVWAAKEIWKAAADIKKGETLRNLLKRPLYFVRGNYLAYFLILFLFIFWGIIKGYAGGNEIGAIFADFNGYLYFALIFPVYGTLNRYREIFTENPFNIPGFMISVLQVFMAALTWLAIKGLALLYVFSHNFITAMEVMYEWTRAAGVGEITDMSEGMYRIFFQSHLFTVIGLFIILFLLNKLLLENKKSIKETIRTERYWLLALILLFGASASIIFISFSRSLWVGTVVGLLFFATVSWRRYGWRQLPLSLGGVIISGIVGLGIITAVVNFPYPESSGFSAAQGMSRRVEQTREGGAALSSRWALLPVQWEKVKENPVLGKGFGTTVTYISSDPRVLERTSDGEYTTFAMEWGWLEVWLKMGIFGLICYLMLSGKIFFDAFRPSNRGRWLADSLAVGMAITVAVHFFTPYLNHPLGVGYIIFAAVLMDKIRGGI